MPYASSYATAMDPPRTMLSEIDMQRAGDRMASKYIRNNVGPMSPGVTGQTEGFQPNPEQEKQMRPGGMDPRWADPPQRPPRSQMEGFRPQEQPPRPKPTQQVQQQRKDSITAAAVANRIFQKPSDFVSALDDNDSPLHSVAISLLANRRIAGTDRYVYILIICVLAIALTCSLYRINKQNSKLV